MTFGTKITLCGGPAAALRWPCGGPAAAAAACGGGPAASLISNKFELVQDITQLSQIIASHFSIFFKKFMGRDKGLLRTATPRG